MEFQTFIIFFILSALSFCSNGSADSLSELSRKSFPDGFVFGAGSSAYQYEGAAHMYGRTSSIWDTYTSQDAERIADHSNGSIAEEFYFRYKEDIGLMKQIGLDIFKFSISWSRVLPAGRISGGVNWEGVNFYNNLINDLLSEGIQPLVVIFHWDLPQILEDEYKGFLSPNILKDFEEYADFCFKEFGDRVKHWITINEPNMYSYGGYAKGIYAPGRCSDYIGNCTEGNSATEPYIVTHHMILSHALAVQLYRNKYQASQKGVVGIAIFVLWYIPKYQTLASVEAASRARDFFYRCILHPITYGEYPESMQYLVGNRLPKFTEVEAKLVKGSFDFVGVDYYTTYYADNVTSYNSVNLSYTTDSRANLTYEKHGVFIGAQTDCSWLFIYPMGIQEAVVYVNEKYAQPTMYITENGMGDKSSLPLAEALNDSLRIKYHQQHLSNLSEAIKKGVDVRGYMVWTLLDDFEWNDGFTLRFGLTYIDYRNGLKRILKRSALWYKDFLRSHNTTATSHLLAAQ